jgi:hypothetical protein
MKVVFIAGPLTTGGDGSRAYIESNVKKAEAYSISLANAGIYFFCAHMHSSFHTEKGSTAPEEYYYKLDFEILKRAADAVLAVPGWEKSMGAKKEVEWAEKNKIKVFYPKDPSDIQGIIVWAKA